MNSRDYYERRMRYQRPAAVVAWVAVMIPVIAGFTVLGIDMSRLHSVRNDLQRAADAAALAAATALAEADQANMDEVVLAAAQDMADRNLVDGQVIQLVDEDVVFGVATFDGTRYSWADAVSGDIPNGVEITLRRTADSENGAVRLYFGSLIGQGEKDVSASARAVLLPRDIALVCDLSGSMDDDSELRHYSQEGGINLHAIWDALGGSTYGRMTTWGTDPITSSYNPADDSGLLQMTYLLDWSSSAVAHLAAQGYTVPEKNALKVGANDASVAHSYANRVAATLGLAQWHSGFPPRYRNRTFPNLGLGNGDDIVEDGEMVWVVAFPFTAGGWVEWIEHHKDMTLLTCPMWEAHSGFRFRFGLKTFLNYVLEQQSSYAEADTLWQTPEQPLQAVKDAVGEIVDIITELDSGDQLSLEIYATTAVHEADLTRTFTVPRDTLLERQSNHYDNWTCIGCGLEMAQQELSSSRARDGAAKVIILLTDGIANIDANGSQTEAGGRTYVTAQANLAAADNIIIYTVGVGAEADMVLMDEIAVTGRGLSFHATGSVDEYSTELREIFRTLGGKRPAVLIR